MKGQETADRRQGPGGRNLETERWKPKTRAGNKSQPASQQGSIHIDIREVVLHGVAPADRYLIGHTVDEELTQLIRESGVLRSLSASRNLESSNAASFRTTGLSKRGTVGSQVAYAIYNHIATDLSAQNQRKKE